MDHVNFALDCKLLKATHYNGSMFIHKVWKAVLYQSSLSTTIHKEWDHRWGKHSLWPWETEQPTDNVCADRSRSISQMPTNGKLRNVSCVQLSFSNDNTILSKSVQWAVNVIADSVGSVFSMIIIWGNPCIQAAIVIWVDSEATPWVKIHGRYQRTSPSCKSLLKKDDSKVWKATKVVVIHHPEKQYTTKQVEHNLTLWCSGAVSWFD